ncbi:hypothetical protein PR202_gb23090 [Eleusine coracana subsp. coracana]|uniref:non-specific serine/threonine protein kinase n=1 Tax=Eleusine coracana subsp. coracana TaxID=191504 RepID=A0AAV5FI40_ELECO|nr:hypothetical protein PR202_gb23090 [Eleusine coracana subsp. coracana]
MMARVELEPEDEWSDSDVEDVFDSEVGDALDWLDAVEGHDGSTRLSAAFSTAARRPNAHGGVLSRPLQPLSNRTQKLASLIRATPLEEWEGRTMNVGMSSAVTTAIRDCIRDAAIGKTRNNEKADRATVEQVFLCSPSCVFTTIFNIDPFSVQANVYHATRTDGQELAIKVYKTSVLVFKVRAAKIRCPKPLHLRLHVLVMEFIGKGGWPAPRLKDAALSDDKLRESYFEIVTTMRTLYQKCKLVHGDLSEYNILYFEVNEKLLTKGQLYIIDVSQSVDLDHPSALDFLKEDCLHVSDSFRKRGIAVMTATDLFNFVVDQNIADKDVDDYLDEVQQNILENGGAPANDHEVNPTVMVQQEQLPQNTVEETLNLVQTKNRLSGHKMGPEERKVARKENKKKVKEEKREARKTKIPKADKKKRRKMAKAKCNR